MTVLAKNKGLTGDLNNSTGVFVPREWTEDEQLRYESLRGSEQLAIDQALLESWNQNNP